MISLWENILFFLPVFLAVNVLAAVPGKEDLRQAVRLGMKNFAVGCGFMVAGCTVLYFVFEYLISRPPLW